MEGSSSICFFFYFMGFLITRSTGTPLDIKTKGAKGDGKFNDAQAIIDAWKEACACVDPSQVLIPPGTYMVSSPIEMCGPCKNPIEVKADGATFKAPLDPVAMNSPGWFMFRNVDKMTLSGGIFDGCGQESWKTNNAAKTGKCELPYNFRFDNVKGSTIRGISSLNSKHFHMNLIGCDNTILEKVTIDAPAESINTDGIHIGRTNGLTIIDGTIKTGDDCISIGDGSKNIHIDRTTCGPGHGISVGSLGRWPAEEPVDGIFVKGCTITGTDNGLRIKTWPGSPPGIANRMHFEDITMKDVGNPILIDQEYCPYMDCKAETNCSRVKISDVLFKNVKGTSTTKSAIRIICSKTLPCERVELADIDLKFGAEGAISECKNVQPVVTGAVIPQPCTAPPGPFKEKAGAASRKLMGQRRERILLKSDDADHKGPESLGLSRMQLKDLGFHD